MVKKIPFVSLSYSPNAVREMAGKKAKFAAVVINAVNGMFAAAAVCLPMLSFCTVPLVALLIMIFGPFAGFVASSLYSRVEWTVGRRLGGKSSRDGLYNLFAWSFFPPGIGLMLYGLIMSRMEKPSTTTELVAAVPFLVLFCFAVRNYCSNIIACHQFTRTRGIVSVVMSFVLFVVLIVAGMGFLAILFKYAEGQSLNSILEML